ncbi:tRNA (adenine(22)-N(1))-methyltransferase TrmK [Endozoicomonas sp. SM1973]|uniref:tRNA (Adenine(22)-N(1))-methyltransferase TrmK n=1 Tax=Spartinivicinus marinus TaxID=2994442 RepID=A0A853HVZ8_9GAMM|nr:methyltransferase [Spartinivicinus marinus]MCX4028984.1 tRNA (adenine(22)-N(1))-methyltransferase TrmK [Spartinivicinus marinus]NYZ65433.1 tRNA (adenine(22)-N(1))-methyltransferase TrmK [Spartinivicinus marinus]
MQQVWSEDPIKNAYLKGVITLLERSQNENKKQYEIEILGNKFDVLPNVFPPSYFRDTAFFVQNIPEVSGKCILEVGCGTGVTAIMFVLKGAESVVAVDINKDAVKNTILNINRYQLSDRVSCFYSDVFSEINDNEKFDVIYWNIPFGKVNANLSTLQRSVFDMGYAAVERFFIEGAKYLRSGGYLLYGFSPVIGDEDALVKITKNAGLKTTIIAKAYEELKEYSIEFHLCKAVPCV